MLSCIQPRCPRIHDAGWRDVYKRRACAPAEQSSASSGKGAAFTLGLLLGGAALAAVAVVLAAYTYRSSRRSKSRSAVAGRSAREIQGRAGASPGPEQLVAISSL